MFIANKKNGELFEHYKDGTVAQDVYKKIVQALKDGEKLFDLSKLECEEI